MEMPGYTKHVFECLQDVYPVATPKDCSNERAAIVVGVCVSVSRQVSRNARTKGDGGRCRQARRAAGPIVFGLTG